MILEAFCPTLAKSYPGKPIKDQNEFLEAFLRQVSEQYFTDSQFFAQDFLQVISFLQTAQGLLGR